MPALSRSLDFRLFDADNHYYEPLDIFARYIEPAFAERTFVTEQRDGETVVLFDGRPFGFIGGKGNKRRVRPGPCEPRFAATSRPRTRMWTTHTRLSPRPASP